MDHRVLPEGEYRDRILREFGPRDVARVLAEEIGGRILTLNTGHNLSADQLRKGLDFFDLMEDNLSHLKEGLSCR